MSLEVTLMIESSAGQLTATKNMLVGWRWPAEEKVKMVLEGVVRDRRCRCPRVAAAASADADAPDSKSGHTGT